jgi:hypothetical protein
MIKTVASWVDRSAMTTPADGEFDFFAPLPSHRAEPPTVPHSAPQPKASRWAKSDTTFGPVGRVVASIALIVPFLFLAAAGVFTFDPFVLGGAGIWAVLMAMGLRQVWQAVQHHHRR